MTATDDREIQRLARKMASLGQFPDFESIERAMGRVLGEAVQRIGSRGFRRQIDRLCATAQELGTKPAERVNQETAHADP
jgi:hypothetical protein